MKSDKKSDKIFFISLPFDRKNSGDYDYCTTLVEAINKQGYVDFSKNENYVSDLLLPNNNLKEIQAEAEYVTFKKAKISPDKVRQIYEEHSLKVLDNKDKESTFNRQLINFYELKIRKDIVENISNYLKESAKGYNGIINLQIRAPESGFLFSPEEIRALGEKFKIFFNKEDVPSDFIPKAIYTRVPPTNLNNGLEERVY